MDRKTAEEITKNQCTCYKEYDILNTSIVFITTDPFCPVHGWKEKVEEPEEIQEEGFTIDWSFFTSEYNNNENTNRTDGDS